MSKCQCGEREREMQAMRHPHLSAFVLEDEAVVWEG